MSYNSKYSGQQVENLLDQVANGNLFVYDLDWIPDDSTEYPVDLDFTQEQFDIVKNANVVRVMGVPCLLINKNDFECTFQAEIIFGTTDREVMTLVFTSDYVHIESEAVELATKLELDDKVDKVDGKQLSTEDFTTLLKQKLDGLSNYDDTEISQDVSKLRTDLDTLVSGDTTTAIKTFNEVIAFLDGISDTEDLSSIIASIEQQIASKGTVTSVTAGEGLAGGTITGSGIISLKEKAQNGKFIDLMSKVDILEIGNTSSDTNITIDKTSSVWMDKELYFDKFGRLDSINGYYYYPTKVTFGEATTSLKGLMSSSDKAKLDGIDLTGKQDKLVSGTNIKTINGTSILGSGDIVISGGGSSSGGGGGAYAEVSHGTGDTTFALTPNTFHVWDEVASLDLSFADETAGVANEYLFQFTSGTTATTLTLPDGLKWANDVALAIAENRVYQVSVLKGFASVLEFSNIYIPTFSINGEVFQVEEGMTWSDWVLSSYNTKGYYIESNVNLIMRDEGFSTYALADVIPSEVIEIGMDYMETEY